CCGVEEQAADGDAVVGGEPAEAGKAVLELGRARRLHLNLRDACRGEEGRQVGQSQIRSGDAENCGGDVSAVQTDVIGGDADARGTGVQAHRIDLDRLDGDDVADALKLQARRNGDVVGVHVERRA